MTAKNPALVFELGIVPRKQRQKFDPTEQRKETGSTRTARRNFRNAERRVKGQVR